MESVLDIVPGTWYSEATESKLSIPGVKNKMERTLDMKRTVCYNQDMESELSMRKEPV